MSKIPDDLQREYSDALRDYLARPNEQALRRAYQMGRGMLTNGTGVLGIAALHHQALKEVIPGLSTEIEEALLIKRAEELFIESLMPFEMSHRAFRDAIAVLRRMNERIEEEAKRIAHALHEEAGGLLASTHLALEELARDLSPQGRERLSLVKQLLDQMDEQLRQLAHEIRPTVLDDLGLLPALDFLANGMSKRSGVAITVEGSTEGRLSPAVETTLYRNVQEALNNVIRHAQAGKAAVIVTREARAVRCSVRDDGVGFELSTLTAVHGERGLGHVGMRERLDSLHGTLLITSKPGQGAELLMYVPLEG
ncbi:MAG TPA: ATP-binding protein [Candidatus Polarisedimenticolia bacterium]